MLSSAVQLGSASLPPSFKLASMHNGCHEEIADQGKYQLPGGQLISRGYHGLLTLNVARDAKMDPPTHVENLRSGGAVMRILRFFGACLRTCSNGCRPQTRKSAPHFTNPGGVITPGTREVFRLITNPDASHVSLRVSSHTTELVRYQTPDTARPAGVSTGKPGRVTHGLACNRS